MASDKKDGDSFAQRGLKEMPYNNPEKRRIVYKGKYFVDVVSNWEAIMDTYEESGIVAVMAVDTPEVISGINGSNVLCIKFENRGKSVSMRVLYDPYMIFSTDLDGEESQELALETDGEIVFAAWGEGIEYPCFLTEL